LILWIDASAIVHVDRQGIRRECAWLYHLLYRAMDTRPIPAHLSAVVMCRYRAAVQNHTGL
jgi:hypothetical protein